MRRKRILRRLIQFHGAVTAGFLLIYILTALFTDPRFLIRDFRDKFAQAATVNVTLRIIGPPGKPAVTAETACANSSPYVNLNWNATEDTDNYDINRNSQPLITGVTDTNYQDTNVQELTSYTYQVIANGPLGNTASDDAQVATSDCYTRENASCKIKTIAGKNVKSFTGTPKITDRTPKFTGTTNIDNADIDIRVTGGPTINAGTSANDNGYWSWTATEDLDYGTHKISVTATDPNDKSYSDTDSLTFKVVPEEEAVSPSPPAQPSQPVQPPQETAPPSEEISPPAEIPPVVLPIELSLDVKNPDKTAYSGKDLDTELNIKNPDGIKKELEITYTIYDSRDNILTTEKEKITLEKDQDTCQSHKNPTPCESRKIQSLKLKSVTGITL